MIDCNDPSQNKFETSPRLANQMEDEKGVCFEMAN